jgi:hypothetical protein
MTSKLEVKKLFLDGVQILLPTNVHLLLQKSYNFCCVHKLGNREYVKEIPLMAELDVKENPMMYDIRRWLTRGWQEMAVATRNISADSLYSSAVSWSTYLYGFFFCVRFLLSRHGNSSTCGLAQKCWPTFKLVASVLLPSNKHFLPSLPVSMITMVTSRQSSEPWLLNSLD